MIGPIFSKTTDLTDHVSKRPQVQDKLNRELLFQRTKTENYNTIKQTFSEFD